MSQSTEHGAGWYVDGLMGTLLAVLHPDGGAYYYFFITHDYKGDYVPVYTSTF